MYYDIVNRIKRFPGLTQTILRATVDTVASVDDTQWARLPICLDFQVIFFFSNSMVTIFRCDRCLCLPHPVCGFVFFVST